MSNGTKIQPKTRVLFLGTSTADQQIVCITQIGLSESASEINADSFCGEDSIPGTKSGNINLNGQIMEGPTSGVVSYKQLHDWYIAGTTLHFKIARSSPSAGELETSGTGYIQALNTTDDLNAVSTFTRTLTMKAAADVTVHS